MSDEQAAVPIEDLGRVEHGPVHRLMLALWESIRAGESQGKILLVEHEPVYTAGRATPSEQLTDEVVAVERGGQITFHGPGQLVVYPIIPLPRKDVHAWLSALEQFGMDVCAQLGLDAEPSLDGTGVFVGGLKIASIGVAIRRWINLHGISINVAMDLTPFHRIRPCGLDPTVMSDLKTAAGRAITMDEARAAARSSISTLLASGERAS